ncbi:uncharacterized protein METZ01_LOCUS17706 [marine metagenome]|uniref:peptidylprolyl isomerase n=1 Tax=marine metagenome TaxID=408172 RepID=A0A381PCZ1_9ZZZZ
MRHRFRAFLLFEFQFSSIQSRGYLHYFGGGRMDSAYVPGFREEAYAVNDLIARSSDVVVGPGTCIRLHFSILLVDGSEVDSTRGAEPAVFTFGDGSLLPGFENAIAGLREGESAQFEIAARDGFGDCKEVNIQELPIASFAAVGELEPGLVVSFGSPDGELPGVVKAVGKNKAIVDFNHPLAGRALIFDVTILNVRPV